MTTATRYLAIHDAFATLTYAEIREQIDALLRPLTVRELRAVAAEVRIFTAERTKGGIIGDFVRRVIELKTSADRCRRIGAWDAA